VSRRRTAGQLEHEDLGVDYAIGIDLGGTTAKMLAVTPKGRVIGRAVAPTADATWRKHVLRAFRALVADVDGRLQWVGVAAPGLPAPDGRSIAVMPERLPGLEGLDWQEFLGTTFKVPVVNDAQGALLGETWLGAARGSQDVILLTLGTGVGGAILADGQLLRGKIGRAGHLGHVTVDPEGPSDICQMPGSLEDAIGDCTIVSRTGGRFKTTKALVDAAAAGDAEARRIWRRSVRLLAIAIASFVNVIDPEIVVIGGGIAKSGPALFGPLRRDLAKYEWRPAGARVTVLPARLGDRAGAFGAARQGME
jgi:glucokinase